MAFTPDGQLAVGGNDWALRFWDPVNGAMSAVALHHKAPISWISFSNDGRRALVRTGDQMVWLWELPAGRLVRTLVPRDRKALPALTPDGRSFSSIEGSTLTLYSADDGTTVHRTFDVGSWNEYPTFSRDGRYLALWNGGTRSLVVWDVVSGKPVGAPFVRPATHDRNTDPSQIAFSDDGRFLALLDGAFLVVWEVSTGAQVTPPVPVRSGRSLRFHPNSRSLVLAEESARVIDLSPDQRPAAVLAEVARLLANRTLTEHGTLAPLKPAEVQRLWERHRPPGAAP
jgi:WD40 repeat protein